MVSAVSIRSAYPVVRKPTLPWRSLAWAGLVVIVSTVAAAAVASRYDEVAAALIFMLGIAVAGAFGGLVSAMAAALAAFLIFNFLISEPVLTFRLATGRDLAPLVIFNLCAIVTGILAGRLRDRSEAAAASNVQLNNILKISRSLQAAPRLTDMISALERVADPLISARLSLFRCRGEHLEALGPSSENEEVRELAVSVVASDQRILQARALLALRLDGADGPIGALVLKGSRAGEVDVAFLNAVGTTVALAMERADLSEQIAERRAASRAEELKTALLSSVSHDFRTPLAAISASASSLLAYGDRLDPDTSIKFLRRIVEDCDRLNRYTANLLELSRLEAGGELANPQTLSVAEMIGVAVQRVRGRAGDRVIRTAAGDSDLLVRVNPALFELVLINVLENAILYSENGTRIVVTARRDADRCRISVTDEGCGIPHADLERVFERFYRVNRAETSPKGSGLGLAIAKGFVEASGGTIEASTPGIDATGTKIIIRLPLAPDPVNA